MEAATDNVPHTLPNGPAKPCHHGAASIALGPFGSFGSSMKQIRLSQGMCALVDDADYDGIVKWKWFAARRGRRVYAARNILLPSGCRTVVYMHREILRPPPGMDTDHINRDPLDNRRVNLRACTRSQNMANQRAGRGASRFKGVCWDKNSGKWLASIMRHRKHHYLGRFEREVDAARAYTKAARAMFGEFALSDGPGMKTPEQPLFTQENK